MMPLPTFTAQIRSAMLALAIGLFACANVQAAPFDPESSADPVIDWPMFRDPEIPQDIWKVIIPPRIVGLWQMGLDRSDADVNIGVAKDVVTAAAIEPEMMKEMAPTLRQVALDKDRAWSVRAAAVRALGAIDATNTAEQLHELAQSDSTDMVLVCDAVLAKWKYAPAESNWRTRVLDKSVSNTLRISAIDALRVAGFSTASVDLAEVAFAADTPMAVRLAAGEALGTLVDQGLAPGATALLQMRGEGVTAELQNRARQITAARALSGHSDDASIGVLMNLVREGDTGASVIAAAAVLQNRPAALDPIAASLATRNDASMRLIAAQALANMKSNVAVGVLGDMLADADPRVRGKARELLQELDGIAELSPGIRAKAKTMLSSSRWQGVEQATLLLGLLRDRSSIPVLVGQMSHERWEVRMATAASLRWLDAREHAPAMVQRIETVLQDTETTLGLMMASSAESRDIYKTFEQGDPRAVQKIEILTIEREEHSLQLRHMELEMMQWFQTLGRLEAVVVEPLTRRLLPKGSIAYGDARGAAIWTLGILKQDKLDAPLAAALAERLNDINDPLNPEFDIVRQFSAVALGRMKAAGHLSSLNDHAAYGPVGHSCRWAIEQITGRELAPLPGSSMNPPDWFLMPLSE